MNDEEAKEIFLENIFHLYCWVPEFKKKVKLNCALFQKSKSDISIVQHYGGGSGLLKSEILLALETLKY
jgi:hypothetical protein